MNISASSPPQSYAKIRDLARWRLEFATEIRLEFSFDEKEKFISSKAEQAIVGS